jgi:hypothetical protein
MNSEINSGISNNIFLVVVYKMRLTESTTIQSIVNYLLAQNSQVISGCRLFIWDNSPNISDVDVQALREQLPAFGVQYVHTPENCSLSKIYNDVASKLSAKEYLTLLDQDTELPLAYFEELRLAQSEQWPLILPKVDCQGLLVSPGRRFFAQGIRLKEIKSGATKSKNLLAINSGMSILASVFHSFKYDERLRFYGTDTFFMRNYEKYFDQAFVLETPISHSLAVMERKSEGWHSAYKGELIRTFDIIYINSICEALFVRIYVIYIRLKYLTRNSG